MKKLGIIGAIILASAVGGATCQRTTHSSTSQDQMTQSSQQATPDQRQVPPPPPPFPTESPVAEARSAPEPVRTLVGMDSKQLSQIGAYLPEGSSVATFPISNAQARAAIAYLDLNGDGVMEIIVVFNTPQTNDSLFLGVLAHNGDKMTLQSSVRLSGDYVYTNIYDRLAVPFAVRDVTGDSVPEILVTSSQGASLGAQLQVFSFDGSTLRHVADFAGNYIRLIDRGKRQAIISTQWKDESQEQAFEWKGNKFEKIR